MNIKKSFDYLWRVFIDKCVSNYTISVAHLADAAWTQLSLCQWPELQILLECLTVTSPRNVLLVGTQLEMHKECQQIMHALEIVLLCKERPGIFSSVWHVVCRLIGTLRWHKRTTLFYDFVVLRCSRRNPAQPIDLAQHPCTSLPAVLSSSSWPFWFFVSTIISPSIIQLLFSFVPITLQIVFACND